MRIVHSASALLLVAFGSSFGGCGSSSDAAPTEDPAFTQSYVEDYESDVEEDQAQADEQAQIDQLDDLDDVEALTQTSSALTTEGYGTKGLPPKHAPHGPLSIMEDGPHFATASTDPGVDRSVIDESGLSEARSLGARIIRIGVGWKATIPTNRFDATRLDATGAPLAWDYRWTTPPKDENENDVDWTNPASYDWSAIDVAIDTAHANGMSVLLTFSPPMPFWASEQPDKCLADYTADQAKPPDQPRTFWSCSWKPNVRMYASWIFAAGKHFKSKRIWGFTLLNEPNVYPFLSDDDVPSTGVRYRRMWFAGRKALRHSFGVARVFFGDMANVAWGTFKGGTDYAQDGRFDVIRRALCLQKDGAPFRGAVPYDCPAHPRVVHATGVAFHPYSPDPQLFAGSVAAYESIVTDAEMLHRLDAGRGIYLTEHAFLTGADPSSWVLGMSVMVTPDQQRDYDDAVARIVWKDARVKTVAQYNLFDDGRGQWDCGLRLHDGTKKPAYDSYKIAIVVSPNPSSPSTVKVFSLARLASSTPIVVAGQYADGSWHDLDGIPTDETGFGEKVFPSTGIVAWKTHYLGDESRVVATP